MIIIRQMLVNLYIRFSCNVAIRITLSYSTDSWKCVLMLLMHVGDAAIPAQRFAIYGGIALQSLHFGGYFMLKLKRRPIIIKNISST